MRQLLISVAGNDISDAIMSFIPAFSTNDRTYKADGVHASLVNCIAECACTQVFSLHLRIICMRSGYLSGALGTNMSRDQLSRDNI